MSNVTRIYQTGVVATKLNDRRYGWSSVVAVMLFDILANLALLAQPAARTDAVIMALLVFGTQLMSALLLFAILYAKPFSGSCNE